MGKKAQRNGREGLWKGLRNDAKSLFGFYPQQSGHAGPRILPLARHFGSQIDGIPCPNRVRGILEGDSELPGEQVAHLFPFVDEKVGREFRVWHDLNKVRFHFSFEVRWQQEPTFERI